MMALVGMVGRCLSGWGRVSFAKTFRQAGVMMRCSLPNRVLLIWIYELLLLQLCMLDSLQSNVVE
jgi:hypothetical protein